MTTRETSLVVSDTSGIRAIAQRISVWRIERRALDVQFPVLDDEANAAVRRRISLHYGACGCHQGRAAGFAVSRPPALRSPCMVSRRQ